MLGPCGSGMSTVVCRIVNADRVGVSGKAPRDLLSGLITDILRRTTTRILNGPTSVKLIGVNKLHGVLPGKSVAMNTIFRVLPFRGSLYILAVGNASVGHLFGTVTSLRKRNMDNVHLRVGGGKRLLGTAVNKGPMISSRLCAITAVSCLTSKGKHVSTFLRTRGERYPRSTALHKLFLSCMQGRATRNGVVASGLSKHVAMGWMGEEVWGCEV